VDIGGYRLHLWCAGSGTPAVILDSGLGGTSADWGYVQPDVARFTRVCSYDRAGMGYSDPGPSPRTARRIAGELAELLARGGIDGPVVLVGASIAGFTARVFASDHPERVAGLVLVDATHEDQQHEVPALARFVPLLSTIGALRLLGVSFGQRVESLAPSAQQFARATSFRGAGFRAAADELTHVWESVSEVRSSRRKLTVPVVVVTGARGADENWKRLQRDQASLSDRGCVVVAQRSGHVVPIDEPQVIVDAIRSVVETARGHDVRLRTAPGGSALNGAAPVDPVSGIIDAFATYPIVAFGEDHGNQQGHALRLQLVRDPRFAATVNDIVVEFGDALYQKVIDRFIEGEDVPDPILRRVWQDTTMPHPIWDRPIYEEFFRAVRSVNTALPAGRRLRVLLGDPPIDWTRVRSAEDIKHVQTTLGRDRFPAHLVLEEVLAKNRRALVIYGGAHLWRQNLTGTTLVERIEAGRGHTVFTVLSHPFANFGVVVPDISSWQAPSLALTRGTALENQVDAVLYLGPASAMTRSRLSRALCADPAYREMRRRRMALVMKDADEVLRAECGEGLSK
jgi:pimeloyl-ACP methyl ester carboxylesterase